MIKLYLKKSIELIVEYLYVILLASIVIYVVAASIWLGIGIYSGISGLESTVTVGTVTNSLVGVWLSSVAFLFIFYLGDLINFIVKMELNVRKIQAEFGDSRRMICRVNSIVDVVTQFNWREYYRVKKVLAARCVTSGESFDTQDIHLSWMSKSGGHSHTISDYFHLLLLWAGDSIIVDHNGHDLSIRMVDHNEFSLRVLGTTEYLRAYA